MNTMHETALLAMAFALGGCGGGSADGSSANAASRDALSIESPPQSLLVKDGEHAMFNVTGVMGGAHVPLRYQWRRNDVDLPGETRPWLLLDRASPADDQARYTVVVGDGVNQTTSAPGVLAVVPADAELPWR